MRLEQQIAINLAEHKELTVSEKVVKVFRQWLIEKGGACTKTGDVIIRGKQVHFEAATKRHAFRVSLQEVTP